MSLDQRTRYSQMVIRESIFSLLQQKPFHKISVTDVCKQAGINRTTFYKYYQDLYDWKEQLEQECLHRVADILDISSLDDMQEMLTQKLQEIHDDGELYALISSPNFESSILNSIAILVLDKVDAEVKSTAVLNGRMTRNTSGTAAASFPAVLFCSATGSEMG